MTKIRGSAGSVTLVGLLVALAAPVRAGTEHPPATPVAPTAASEPTSGPVSRGEVPVASALDALPEVTLDDVVAAALAHNPALEAARYDLAQAEEAVTQVWSSLLPKLSITGTYTRFNKEMSFTVPDFSSISIDPAVCNGATFCFTRFSSQVMQPADAYGYQASVTVPVFVAPVYFTIGQVRRVADAARLGTEHGRQALVAAATNLYWAALGAQSVHEVTARAELQGKKHLRAAGQWRLAGAGTDLAVTQAELGLVKAEQDRVQAEENYRIVLKNLAIMTGGALARPAKLDSADAPLPTEDEAIRQALANRRDYLAEVALLESARSQHRAALAAYLPSIVATGTYQGQNVANFNGDKTSWNAMLVARWDLFDGFGRESKVAQSAAAVSAQEASVRAKEQQITLEVNQALMAIAKARAQQAVLVKQVELASRNAQAIDVAYENGASTNLEYDDAQSAYTQAQLGLAGARLQVAMARTSLEQALGCIGGCAGDTETQTTTGTVALEGGE